MTVLTFLPKAGLFAGGDTDGAIRLLDPRSGTGRIISLGQSSTGGVYDVAGADLSGDRRPEIVAGAGSDFSAFTLSGVRLWTFRAGSFATSVTPVDLTGDGRSDVVALSWDGKAYGLSGVTGRALWSLGNGQPAGAAVVRASGGAPPRILVVTVGDGSFVGVRMVDVTGRLVASCRLRKTPWAVRTLPGPGGRVDAVLSTEQGDVYDLEG